MPSYLIRLLLEISTIGNFSDCLVGFFGGVDIKVDPYSLSTSGGVRIVALAMMDIAIRHAVSFAYGNDGA